MNRAVWFALLAVAVVALLVVPTFADMVALSLTPSTLTSPAQTPFDLFLDIAGLGNGTALGAYDVVVTFDPLLVSFSSVTFGDPVFGDQLDLEGFGTLTQATPAHGSVELFELSFDSSAALLQMQSGAFTLADLTFMGKAAGTTQIDVAIVALADQNGGGIDANVSGAAVTVFTPEPSTLLLLAPGVFSLGVIRRRALSKG